MGGKRTFAGRSGEVQSPEEGGVPRVIADAIKEWIYFERDQARIFRAHGVVELGKGAVNIAELRVDFAILIARPSAGLLLQLRDSPFDSIAITTAGGEQRQAR